MTDAEKLFKETERERKKLGYGDRHKKRGGGRYVHLPSDYMTKKEREAMNGEVFHYDPRKWYSWSEFKAMPDEYQVKYVNSLLNRYNCSFSSIANVVFDTSPVTLRDHFKRRNQLQFINMPPSSSKKLSEPGSKKLREDYERDNWPNRDEIQNGSEEGIEDKVKPEEAPCLMAFVPVEELSEKKYEALGGSSFSPVASGGGGADKPVSISSTSSEIEGLKDPIEDFEFKMVMDGFDPEAFEFAERRFKEKKIRVILHVFTIE